MDQAAADKANEAQKAHQHHDVAVAVITPSGIFPGDDELVRIDEKSTIIEVLKRAAEKLKLTNIDDWVAYIDGKEIDPGKTFKDMKLSCIVEIDFHKREGGGGA